MTALLGCAVVRAAATQAFPISHQRGNVYIVDCNHPAASDSNSGGPDDPWLTIQHAADVVAPGDIVQVRSGYYPERVILETPGLAGAAITFQADPWRSVTMFGFDIVGADHSRVEGFDIISDASLTGWTERYGVFIRSDHVAVVGNAFTDIKATAIQGYWHEPLPQQAYIADNNVYRSQQGIGITGAGWLVEGNEVERLFDHGGGDCDYARFFGDDHIIRANLFHGTRFEEIGSAHVDCFQTFDNNGEFAHDVVIEGNRCTDFHQGFMGEAHYYHDISRITFKNNVFAHGGAWGLAIEDISYLTAVNNTFVDIQYHGIGLSGPYAHHAVVKNNIFCDTGTSYWFPEGSESVGDHNLIFLSRDPPVGGVHDVMGVDPVFSDYGADDFRLGPTSPAIDAAESLAFVDIDFDGKPRPYGPGWDIGAFEFRPSLALHAVAGDRRADLQWIVDITLPVTSTWQIAYFSQSGTAHLPVIGLPNTARAYVLEGLTNYEWYTVTLGSVSSDTVVLSATTRVMPTDLALFLPMITGR